MWERCVFLLARYWIFFRDGHCLIVLGEEGNLFCIKWRKYFHRSRIFLGNLDFFIILILGRALHLSNFSNSFQNNSSRLCHWKATFLIVVLKAPICTSNEAHFRRVFKSQDFTPSDQVYKFQLIQSSSGRAISFPYGRKSWISERLPVRKSRVDRWIFHHLLLLLLHGHHLEKVEEIP